MASHSELFTALTTEEAATVKGGRCRHNRASYRPFYYSYRSTPVYSYYYPSYGGYGYGYGAVSQSVNINVRVDD